VRTSRLVADLDVEEDLVGHRVQLVCGESEALEGEATNPMRSTRLLLLGVRCADAGEQRQAEHGEREQRAAASHVVGSSDSVRLCVYYNAFRKLCNRKGSNSGHLTNRVLPGIAQSKLRVRCIARHHTNA